MRALLKSNPSLVRFHQFSRRFTGIPHPSKISSYVRERTLVAYEQLKIAWSLYRACLGGDALDSEKMAEIEREVERKRLDAEVAERRHQAEEKRKAAKEEREARRVERLMDRERRRMARESARQVRVQARQERHQITAERLNSRTERRARIDAMIRDGRPNCDIALACGISAARVSQIKTGYYERARR